MNRNPVFALTRLRLAGLYTGTMGLILLACSFAFYEATVQSHWHLLNRKLESVAGTLHDGIEPALDYPGQLEPIADHFLPGLVCFSDTPCAHSTEYERSHIAGVGGQEDSYVRFLNVQGEIVATAGTEATQIPVYRGSEPWQTLTAADGTRYRQLSLSLKTQSDRPWGEIQVGLSLQEYDDHLAWLGTLMLLGVPAALLLVAIASWWLAGFAMRPVYRSYQQIQQFTADAAHELRTPIAAIQAVAEFAIAESELSDSEARQALHTITRQNHRLSQLVQDLLLLSRIDLQRLPTKPEPCCLNELVEDLIDGFSPLAQASDIDLKADQSEPEPLYVLGDGEKLYRLFANLIVNALHYTPPGGQVAIALEREGASHALLHVQDTGIGIPLADQTHIFERFYRVNRDRARQSGGVGLGLAISQAIAHAHHGTIQVRSEPGEGSTFTVRLPIRSAYAQEDAHPNSRIFKV